MTAQSQAKPKYTVWTISLMVIASACFICIFGLVCLSALPTPSPTSTTSANSLQPTDQQSTNNNPPSATRTPRPTEAPPTAVLGETRDQPFPSDATIDINPSQQLVIIGVTRPANDIVESSNMFNSTPAPGQEYMLLNLRITCTKSSNDTCIFDKTALHVVGADGSVRDIEFVAGIPNEFDSHPEFFGGSSIEGVLVFLVTAGDTALVLFHEPFLIGDPVYIAIP